MKSGERLVKRPNLGKNSFFTYFFAISKKNSTYATETEGSEQESSILLICITLTEKVSYEVFRQGI